MFLQGQLSRFFSTLDNFGTNPSATIGTAITPGASNAEGNWTQILSALSSDLAGFSIRVGDGASSANAKNHLLDIGIDPAGGSSYTSVLNNIVCGASGAVTTTGGSQRFYFPFRLPSGATVAARIQGSNATAGTVRVGIRGYPANALTRPWIYPIGQYSETLGTITNSNGVSFTPGNAANGTWVSLGTTTRPLWWWQVGYQIDNGTISAQYTWIELGYGSSGTQQLFHRKYHGGTTGETCGDVTGYSMLPMEAYCPLPAGIEIWIRGRCSGAPDTGYNGVAIGIGG